MWLRYVIGLLILVLNVSAAPTWDTIIESKREIPRRSPSRWADRDEICDALQSKLQQFKEGKAPKIADPIVKEIPIEECREELIDIKTETPPDFLGVKMMKDPSFPFESPDCNAGFSSSSKLRTGIYKKLWPMFYRFDEMASDFGYVPGQITVRVFEGLRSLKTQKKLFDSKAKEIQETYPDWDEGAVFRETSKWVSPVKDNVPVHSTGAAVDIRLWDNVNERFLDMGPFGVIHGPNPTAPTFSEDITEEQKNNRLLLLIAATRSGLTNYPYEWWHFSYGDRYAALDKEPSERKAIYGPIKEEI